MTRPTLFYMPHCPHGLYENVLCSNNDSIEQHGYLKNIFIIGNSFDSYLNSKSSLQLERMLPSWLSNKEDMICSPFIIRENHRHYMNFNEFAFHEWNAKHRSVQTENREL